MSPDRIEPWYGDWPPEAQGSEEDMLHEERDPSVQEIAKNYWWLLAISVSLLVIMFLLAALHWVLGPFHPLLEAVVGVVDALAISAVVATFLVFAVDLRMKHELAQDAFKASVGYLLPPELRSEMQWVYGQKIMCTKSVQSMSISHLDHDAVLLAVKTDRTFENCSKSAVPFHVGLAVDEWFHPPGVSRVVSFHYKYGSESKLLTFKREEGHGAVWVRAEDVDVVLSPRETITIEHRYEEVKRAHDVHFVTSQYPIKEPYVTLTKPVGFSAWVAFAHREADTAVGPTGDSFKLRGTLLPQQAIVLRWWRDEDVRRWVEHAEETGAETQTATRQTAHQDGV